MYRRAKTTDADLTICGYRRVDENSEQTISLEMSMDGEIDTREDKMQLAFINSSLWNKLYKAHLLKNIYSPAEPPRLAEDALLLASIYPQVSKVAFEPKVLYYNYMHNSSAMATVTQEDFRKTREAFIGYSNECPQDCKKLTTVIAFIHCAISFPLLTNTETGRIIRETYEFLSEAFPDWKKSITLRDVMGHKYRGKLAKIYVAILLYRTHLFGLFIPIWKFMSKKLGITIKW